MSHAPTVLRGLPRPPLRTARWRHALLLAATSALIAACGGGSGDSASTSTASGSDAGVTASSSTTTTSGSTTNASSGGNTSSSSGSGTTSSTSGTTSTTTTSAASGTMSQRDAVRLADQATFGPTEAMVTTMKAQGISAWLTSQFAASGSKFTSGQGGAVDQYTGSGTFCDTQGSTCWRDWSSTDPLVWDFYRNAVNQPDQLRQRVAFALSEIVVVSNTSVSGTYGFRGYHNMLLSNAFGNYRTVLKNVALSPVMGEFLNNVNNLKTAPNENFGRELMQLFSLGTCLLNSDGSLAGGTCTPTYTNDIVRNYAYALTGWTYPVGGAAPYTCQPVGGNCRYYDGNMVAVASFHDTTSRALLAGVTVPANSTAASALENVLDSLMGHQNIAPFVSKLLIQHLVSSNPTAAYVGRVAAAFTAGSYQGFGTGVKGDLTATVAAILMDSEARGDTPLRNGGKLREPAQYMAGVVRALGGNTDGAPMGWWWGGLLDEHVTYAPSVFNFFQPDFPVTGTTLLGPEFQIHGDNTALARLNYLSYLIDYGGSAADSTIPNSVATSVNLNTFLSNATTPDVLVDRFSNLALGTTLPAAQRQKVIDAVGYLTSATDTNWQLDRVRTAAYLVFASPNYQVIR